MPSDVDIQEVNWDRLVWNTDKGSVLGQGSFGVVYLGALDGSPVAIKVVKPSMRTGNLSDETNAEAEASAMKQHRREIHRLAAMRNPYVIQYLGVFRNPQSRALYIVTEYLEGRSLHESMCRMRVRNAVLDERSFLAIARQMIYGLNHVHLQLYTHGDIKPQNILLSAPLSMTEDRSGAFAASFPQSAKVKIADFGLSKRLEGAKNVVLNDMTVATSEFGEGPCGTFLYMAPEAFGGVAQLSDADAKAADIYAYGLILFELLSGVQSWSLEGVRNIIQLSRCVHEGKRPSWGERRNQIKPKYIDLVERCWRHEPSKRPNAGDIVVEIKALSRSFENQCAEGDAHCTLTAKATLSASPNATPLSPRDEGVNVMPKASSSELVCDSGGAPPSLPPEIHSGNVPNRHGQRTFATSTELKVGESQPSQRRHGNFAHDELSQPVSGDPTAVQDKIPSSPVTIPKIRSRHIVGGESQKLDAPSKLAGSCGSFHGDGRCEEHSKPTNDTYASTGVQVPPKKDSATSIAPLETGTSDKLRPARLDKLSDVKMPQNENRHPSNAAKNLQNGQGRPIDVLEAGQDSHGIDDSFLGGVQVMRVQTVCLPTPSPLQVPQDPEGRATMGTGSIEPNARPPSSQERRSGDDILNSFIQCGKSEVHVDENSKIPISGASIFRGDYSLNEESKKRSLPKVQGSSIVERNPATDNRSSKIAPIASDGGAVCGLPVVAELPLPLRQHENKEQLQRPMERIQMKPKARETPSSETHNVRVEKEQWFPSNVARPQHQVQSHLPRSPSDKFPICHAGMGNMVLSPPPDPTSNIQVESSRFEDASIRAQRERPLASPTSYQPYGSMIGQGATTPLLSETGYGATGLTMLQTPMVSKIPTRLPGRPEHGTPGSHNFESLMTKQCHLSLPHSDMEEVCHALRTPDAVKQLRVFWNQGCAQEVAGALAQARDLKGGDFLSLTCDFLGPRSSCKHDPFVDRGLCTAIGNISRNASDSIKPQLVLQALRVTVSTMFAYRTSFAKNELASVQLYTACNFALCNLLRVNNSIEDVKLRSDLAKWILYVISWKIPDNGSARGAQADTLCYEVTCAARNFMWRNEANAQAFTEETGVRDAQLIESLIASMKHFDWKGNVPLLEACLSAVAVAITIPQHRKEFMNLQGIALVLDALHRRLDEVKKAKLGLSMITALIAWSGSRREERDILEDVCVKDQVCFRLLKLLEVMQHPWRRPNKTKLETLSIGYGTLLRCMELGEQLHEREFYETAVRMTSLTFERLCMFSETDSGVLGAWKDLCVQVCEVLQLLAREPRARLLLQQKTSVFLKQLMGDRGHDGTMIGCMQTTLNILEKSQ